MVPENEDLVDSDLEDSVQTPDGGVEPQVIIIDGVAYTPEDVLNLKEKEKNLVQGFHKKTTALAKEREELNASLEEAERERTLLRRARIAQQKDLDFYNTHSPEEWASYESEYNKLMGSEETREQPNTPSKEVLELKNELNSLKSQLSSFETETSKAKANEAVELVNGLCEGKFGFADSEVVRNEMFVYYQENHRLPTKSEITEMVKKNHNKSIKAAEKYLELKDQAKNSRVGSIPAPAAPSISFDKDKPVPKLGDIHSAVDAGRDFFQRRSEARKS